MNQQSKSTFLFICVTLLGGVCHVIDDRIMKSTA